MRSGSSTWTKFNKNILANLLLTQLMIRAGAACVSEHKICYTFCPGIRKKHFYTIVFLLFLSLFGCLLCEVEVHFVIDHLALWIETLQDLSEHVDRLLAAQTCALCLELLQQVFGGHRLTDQVAAHSFLRQLHVTVRRIFVNCDRFQCIQD